MVVSNRERVGKAMDSLMEGLIPYIEREMQRRFGKEWDQARSLDVSGLLYCIVNHWSDVFSQKLGWTEKSHASELIEVRNKWAHQKPFPLDDTDRALDTVVRLLRAVSAPQADEIDRERQEVLRIRFESQTTHERKPSTAIPRTNIRSDRVDPISGFVKAQLVRTPRAYPLCECGCGEHTGGGRFRPGHDAKLKSRLIKIARAEGEDKNPDACEAAWNQLGDLGWSHMFNEEHTRLTAQMNRLKAARRARA